MATMKGSTTLSLLTLALAAAPAFAQEAALVERSSQRLAADRATLGLDARHAFAVQRGHGDELGQTHTRFQQTFQGVKVWGGEAITHMDAEGSFKGHTLALHKGLNLNTTPALSETEALAAAHVALAPKGAYAHAPKAELVIFPTTTTVSRLNRLTGEIIEREITRHALAYHVHTELENGAETRHTDYMIDAHTGAILKEWNDLRTTDAVGTGNSQFSGTVSMHTNLNGSSYELKDLFRAMNITTYNLNHGTSGTGTVYTDADNTWGDGANYVSGGSTTSANGQTAGVDAHYGAEASYDYFKNIHGRNGIDGANRATYSRVHYSSNYVNAFWSDSCFCMTYGDGDGTYKVLTALDVAAHEMSHGVCANSANLTYSGESGGLNESNSDIFGAMVEIYSRNGGSIPATVANGDMAWTIGEQVWPQNSSTSFTDGLRYMYKPSQDNSSKDAWYSGIGSIDVHYSSGPNNRMFFFLSQGSSNSSTSPYYSSYLPAGMTGVGPEKAAKIWYRTLTTYLTSTSNYAAARTGAISSAQDLYGAGGAEEAAVWNAFAAINVGSAWSGGGGGGDTTAPTVSASESGTSGTITFNATASDNVGVTKVEWYVDGGLKGSDTTSPYSMTYNSTLLADGSHTLVAKAYDAAGNVGTSSSVSFSVNNGGGGGTGTEKIVNGGFESGTTGWTQTSGVIGSYSSQPAHGGAYDAWLCGYGSTHTDYVYQQIAIPSTATSATLSFWMHIDTDETTTSIAYDKMYVQVLNSSGSVLKTFATYSNLNEATGYVQKSFDLSAYKGQTIRVRFRATEDSSLQTSFVVDDVSVKVQ